MRKIITCGVAGILLLVSGIASATLFDFSYNNLAVVGKSTVNSANMTVDGITVNITAYTVKNDDKGNISDWELLKNVGTGIYISGSKSGNLGVKSSAVDGSLLDGGNASNDLDEGLLFSFSETVTLDYLNFDYFTENGGDDFNLTVDGSSILWDVNATKIGPFTSLVSGVVSEFDEYVFNNITGRDFFIWADGDSDSFRIDKLRVSTVPAPSVVWLLLIGGLMLLSFKAINLRSCNKDLAA